MEKVLIDKTIKDYPFKLEWKLNGNGECYLDLKDSEVEEFLKEFASAAQINLTVSGEKHESDNIQYIEALGILFSEAICRQCELLKNFKGIGCATVDNERSEARCTVQLPSRMDWYFEILTQSDNIEEDGGLKIISFFKSMARCAKLRLSFDSMAVRIDENKMIFCAFGKALRRAFE
ncbi:MAG: hypothetical protein ACOYB8_11565 [Eubacteriaceae bacterium]|jgi:imidazoleglycerol phosphate dehydratase HisB